MTRTALLAAAAGFAISAGSASAASPVVSSKGFDVHATRLTIPSAGLTTLYSQNDHDGGTSINSQMFGSSYDDQGADDFVVPPGSVWKVKEVDVTGVYFNGAGPATENVYFYKNVNETNLPNEKPFKTYSNITGADNGGSFAIKIPTTELRAGHYWVSVQAKSNFNGGGEWGWELRSIQNNNPAAWQNPGGVFGVCPTWNTLEYCFGGNSDPDFMFALKGRK